LAGLVRLDPHPASGFRESSWRTPRSPSRARQPRGVDCRDRVNSRCRIRHRYRATNRWVAVTARLPTRCCTGLVVL